MLANCRSTYKPHEQRSPSDIIPNKSRPLITYRSYHHNATAVASAPSQFGTSSPSPHCKGEDLAITIPHTALVMQPSG